MQMMMILERKHCWKGGYGASKLIPALSKIKQPKKEKFFVGFSDITALHVFLEQKWGWKPVHGATFSSPVRKEFDIANTGKVLDIVTGRTKSIEITDIQQISGNVGSIQGKVTGGNLCMIEQSIGTLWQIDMKDKIVILEDVDERNYRIDRMFDHLIQADIITKAKAIVLGQFTQSKDEKREVFELVVQDLSKKFTIPIYRTKSIGHEFTNIPFVYGAEAKISKNLLTLNW
jgi:muramoyltetrapeptide carboxypeptidase